MLILIDIATRKLYPKMGEKRVVQNQRNFL